MELGHIDLYMDVDVVHAAVRTNSPVVDRTKAMTWTDMLHQNRYGHVAALKKGCLTRGTYFDFFLSSPFFRPFSYNYQTS